MPNIEDNDQLDVAAIQAAIDDAGAGWVAGETVLSRLPREQRRRRLGYVPGPHEPSLQDRELSARVNRAGEAALAPRAAAAPSRYDLRDVGGRSYVTRVKDQGGCGSCVAFGTLAAVESQLRIAHGDADLDVDFSEAHLFYCHARSQGRNCDNGWWPESALNAVRNLGVVDDGCYPYTDVDQVCSNLCSDSSSRLTFIDGWRRFVTTASMKLWISNNGPLITCFSVYDDFFALSGQVYRHVTGSYAGGHCVCVVGYDDDGDYWICKNSWGSGPGTVGDGDGFFRIAYGEVGIDAEMWTVEGVRPYGPANSAAFIQQSVPAAVQPGAAYPVSVRMRNTGIQAWTPARRFRLGSQNPQDNLNWGLGRVELSRRTPPGAEADFGFTVVAPQPPAHLQWRMLQEGVEWFGEATPDILVPAAATAVRLGVTIKVRHWVTGRALHSHPLVYGHPGTSGQQQVTCFAGSDDNDLWLVNGPDGQPSGQGAGQSVQHGDVIRLEHVLTRRNLHSHGGFPSPVTRQQEVTCFGQSGAGDANDNWRVEVDGGRAWQAGSRVRLVHVPTNAALHSHQGFSHPQWTSGQQEVTGFGPRDHNDWWIATDFRARDARFVAQSVPTSLVVGTGADVSVAMCNTGTETWTPGSYRLGSQSPQDNQIWGLGRVELLAPVPPGETAVLAFHVTAPGTPGAATFHWQMLQEGVTWFGEPTRRVTVQVVRQAGPTTVPDVEGMVRANANSAVRQADLVPQFTGASGAATEVGSQNPAAGTSVPRGSVVTLRMVTLR